MDKQPDSGQRLNSSWAAEPPLIEHLAAGVAGSYVPNLGIINLRRDVSIFNPENEETPLRFAVFMHEYAHYVHNFSTIAGIYGFVASLRRLKIFANTVDRTGKSHGIELLEAEGKREFRSVFAWQRHLQGDIQAPATQNLQRPDVAISVAAVTLEKSVLQLGPQEFPLTAVRVDYKAVAGGEDELFTIRLGTLILTEGLAWEIEQMIYSAEGVDSGPLTPRPFPYRIGRMTMEAISGHRLSNRVMAQVFLLAMQTTDPGLTFVQICYKLREAISEPDVGPILRALTDEIMGRADVIGRNLSEGTLALEIAGLVQRGAAGRGLVALTDWCRRFLEKRREEPFFELDLLAPGADRVALSKALNELPPCPVAQERADGEGVSLLVFGDNQHEPHELAVAQAMLHFANSHYANGSIVETSRAHVRPCPFHGSCDAMIARTSPEICQQRPWQAAHPESEQICWYGYGTLAISGCADR